ncbi:MAG TPA: hypothetical protein VFU43_06855 [Streptosporangiaceae bacterium]|nr:hypothetical protein [Streptosporangiaceae bacterium]
MQTPSTTVRLRFCSIIAAVATAAAIMLTQTGAGAAASPPTAVPESPADTYDKLSAQIGKLEKQYGGELAKLRDAQYGLKRAFLKAGRLKAELAGAQELVAQMAASRYMNSGVEPEVAILASGDPNTVIDGAALATHLSQSKAARVQQIQSLIEQQKEAEEHAQEKVAAFKRTVSKLQSQKARVRKLLQKFKPSSQVIGAGGLTARMVKVRTEVDVRFGPFPVIGCLRPGDPQDHGSGRACDFMESTGGAMPSADRQRHGDQVAEWAIANASRLGIKYVIWRQRIYDMRSPGWDPMENRGSVTANHYDHVHISVF